VVVRETRLVALPLVSSVNNFTSFLLLLYYFFIPWTYANLVDYYIVPRGHYAIEQIFTPNGIYGQWASVGS